MKRLLFIFLFSIPLMAQTTYLDSVITGTDTISVFTNNNAFEYISVAITDTGTAYIDTFYVEKYNPLRSTWERIGAKNTLTWANAEVLVPGTGNTVVYTINAFYQTARYIRVRKINSVAATWITANKTWITWQGVNQ